MSRVGKHATGRSGDGRPAAILPVFMLPTPGRYGWIGGSSSCGTGL